MDLVANLLKHPTPTQQRQARFKRKARRKRTEH